MGKKQKSKAEESGKDDVDLDALAAEIEGAGASKEQKGKAKKKEKKKKQDFDEDDILKELEELSLENQGGKSNKDSVQKKPEIEEPEVIPTKQEKKKKAQKGKKASFDEDEDHSDEMENKSTKPRKEEKPKIMSESDDGDDSHFNKTSKKGKGKNEPINKKTQITKEAKDHGKEKVDIPSDSDEDSDELSRGKKGKKKEPKAKSVVKADSGDEEGEFKIKTAAQKKAEKKERERKKKEEEKAKLRKQKEKEEAEGPKKEPAKTSAPEKIPEETATKKDKKPVVAAEPAEVEEDDDEDDEGDKKKKDKKKKKGEKEDKDKKKKGPSSATVKAMQEALARMKEEEERLKREEEERLKRLEELEAKRLEEERLEQERKERKKQKEKERKERLKKEGKLLTKAQKEARARHMATLMVLQAQGVEVPSKDSLPKKKPIYENKKKKKAQQQTQNKEEQVEASSPVDEVPVSPVPEKEEPPLSAEPPDMFFQCDSNEDSGTDKEENEDDIGVDDWEARISDEEKDNRQTVHIEVQEKNEDEDDEDEDDDEDNDEESEEEDEDDEGDSSEDEKSVDEKPEKPAEPPSKPAEKKPVAQHSSDSESDSDDDRTKEERAYDKAKKRIEKRRLENQKTINPQVLRAPVICVLGHVDTGKTKILDKLRHTHVQDSEAGGITQQIGATNVPLDAIKEQTKMVKNFDREDIKIPGMLIIDTPGHESFSNLRNRGSSLCDIAILVVDIMHGLEPQTIESLNLLKNKKCPFIVALNKIDRLYDWKKSPETDVAATLKKQKKNTKDEFEERTKAIIVEFAQQGLNAALFYENKDPRTFVSLVPTSAHTGDGMGNLISLLVDLTQTMLSKRLAHSEELRAQVMEVKALPGMGTTIDVILINGRLREGDTVIVPGVEGPIVTQIRGLLLPPPMKELRVKNQYEKHKEVLAAQGVKILGKDLEKTLAGLPFLVAHKEDEIPVLREDSRGQQEDLQIRIGPVHNFSALPAVPSNRGTFDVRIEREAQEMADSLGVRIFSAEIIYHLFDAFTKYRQDYKKQKQEEFKHIAVFPCKVRILPQFIFNSRDPIVMGVVIEAGQLKQGTPICVPSKNFVDIGIVTSIEINHKTVDVAKKGQEVCVKIEPIPGESPKMYGRHFEATDHLVSKITRQSIDALKNWFRDEMQKTDWQLIVELKKVFEII
ncbi:hypothetical protein GDO81_005498 [Engystomops pustulosus]|uniref:Eukaryotic translation initiation factor 5B n=2 Tax=Engystomops pustulosus TaxID=76066 RepID=A0AAV7CP10_ENGPU|nr:hypothetical protein GDO81_005498 [Engystomops pustulosus]